MTSEQLAEKTANFDASNLPASPPAKVALADFATRNPEAIVEDGKDFYVVRKPWGDENLVLRIPHNAGSLINGLSQLRLPPRFTAVWHLNSGDIEFIYGPVPEDSPTRSRSFTFHFKDRVFTCQFADSSDILKSIAQHARPNGPVSATNYRNLVSLRALLRFQKGQSGQQIRLQMYLTSFWLRGALVDENDLPDLARHINFYMRYFDRHTPMILIHEQPGNEPDVVDHVVQPYGDFPSSIVARQLDPYLLSLSASAISATEPSQRFIYNYQVLEYAAFYYLREDILRSVRRLLTSPEAPSRLYDVSRQILDIIVEERTSDDAKIVAVFQQAVDPAALWREIERKLPLFSESTVFDGGFTLPPLVKTGWGLDDFKTSWIPKLPDIFRKLRNALVHAREQRLAKCITPSIRNQRLLRPWALLSEIVTEQVITYGE
jgi:hypothetical protein